MLCATPLGRGYANSPGITAKPARSLTPLLCVGMRSSDKTMAIIREESPNDRAAVREVNIRAFGQAVEADLVDALRENSAGLLSLVAVKDGQVVAHILFSPATIGADDNTVEGMGLAPMAVLPDYQQQGIGSELVRAGIARLTSTACPFVIMRGHPHYYPRFGFEPASRRGIRSEWEVPDEAFMILVLDDELMRELSGVARYRPAFTAAL